MICISELDLHAWATQVLIHVGVRAEDAAYIARCLVDVDLRGVKSHGTRQLKRYVREFKDGQINPEPQIRTLRESDNAVRLDGDGGAGYLVATQAVDTVCAKARDVGLALASTCNHGHVGSAGIYARRALEHGLISWGMAGGTRWRKPEDSDATVWDAMGAPPMCFGVPSDEGGPPLVLDMNANQFTRGASAEEALAAGFARSVFGSLGMRFVSTLVAGVLSGSLEDEAERRFSAATRGFVFVVIDPDLIGEGADFRARVREIVDESLSLRPMAGTDAAALPGTMEWRREKEWCETGIPLPDDHRALLDEIAAELGLDPPAWTNGSASG
jgi:LDH2 family malate/lactate/ureidoglycolate dehydrogenase